MESTTWLLWSQLQRSDVIYVTNYLLTRSYSTVVCDGNECYMMLATAELLVNNKFTDTSSLCCIRNVISHVCIQLASWRNGQGAEITIKRHYYVTTLGQLLTAVHVPTAAPKRRPCVMWCCRNLLCK